MARDEWRARAPAGDPAWRPSLADLPLILLCGGRSRRMGEPKGLIDAGGVPWLERQIEAFSGVGGRVVAVVLGHDLERHATAIPWIRDALARGAGRSASIDGNGVSRLVAVNGDPEHGPFTSATAGWQALRAGPQTDGRAAFILPVDVPVATADVWLALTAAWNERIAACVPTHDGRGGHPVLLSGSFLDALGRLPADAADSRLDTQIRLLPDPSRIRIEVADDRILINLNRPSDLERISGDWS